jgi:hypothetical protein
MATFIPILAYYGLNNKTIELDIEDKAVLSVVRTTVRTLTHLLESFK